MSILKELTKDFQYEVSSTNPEVRKLTSGPFRGIWVNRNGFCYSERNGKTLKISQGYYKRTDYKAVIKPWRLCALVWHDQTPSLHLDSYDRDKYLNLLAFIKVLEKYPDEYELFMNGLKTNYYPLSRETVINVVTGCLGSSCNNYKRCRLNEYERIKWDYFEEIGDKIEFDFYNFKEELSEELEKNLKGDLPKVTEDKEEDEEDPEEELEICLSDPKLGGAPSLRPKVKEVQVATKVSASTSIEKLQELFDRRAQLKKELAEIEEKIKASIFH